MANDRLPTDTPLARAVTEPADRVAETSEAVTEPAQKESAPRKAAPRKAAARKKPAAKKAPAPKAAQAKTVDSLKHVVHDVHALGAGPIAAIEAFPIETLVEAQREQLTAFSNAGKAWMEGLTAFNREMIDFGEKRAEAILNRSETISTPSGWSDLIGRQVGYTGAAARAYIDETAKLCELGFRITEASWSPLRKSMTDTFEKAFRTDD